MFGFWPCGHVLNLQILEDEGAIVIDQLTRLLMEEVPTLIADLAVASRQFLLGTTAPMAALLPPVNLLMCRLDLLFGVPIEARVLNRGPIGEDSKGLHPQVNADSDLPPLGGRSESGPTHTLC